MAKSASVFTGADKALKDLTKIEAFTPNAFAQALFQEAQIEATECKKLCPVDTGNLRASIHVEGPERSGRRIWCYVVAGGIAETYALIVHEDLFAIHKVGQAKFIEQPLKESAPYLAERIAKRIDLNKAL